MPWFAILRGLTKGSQREEHGMEQGEISRKGKHLTRYDRMVIEGYPPTGHRERIGSSSEDHRKRDGKRPREAQGYGASLEVCL